MEGVERGVVGEVRGELGWRGGGRRFGARLGVGGG